MVLTSCAFAAGQLWIAAKTLLGHAEAPPAPKRIATLSGLAAGAVRLFRYPTEQDPCVLVRTGEGKLLAYSQVCTHLSCAVVPRPEKGDIHCPCHEGFFDLATGRPIAGPPRRPLARIELEVRGDEVWATGVEQRTV